MGCVRVKRLMFAVCRLPLLNFMPCSAASEVVTLSKAAYSAILAGYSNPTLQLIDPFIADGEHVRHAIQGIPSCSVVSAVNFIADK